MGEPMISMFASLGRHCEERGDEAIQGTRAPFYRSISLRSQ